MPSVCEGLAKYSNLINIEYMDDLITCFYDLISNDNGGLNCQAKLHCLITVFSILNKQFVLIHIDPQRFYSVFYTILLTTPTIDNDIDLVIELIQLMLLDRYKQLSKQKLLAFIKRLITMCLHLQSSHNVSAVFEMIKALLCLSPQATDLLYENEFNGSGIQYLPELNDPEYANAQNSTLYELYLLNKIYDLQTIKQCEQIIKTKFTNDTTVIRMCQTNALHYLQKQQQQLSSIVKE